MTAMTNTQKLLEIHRLAERIIDEIENSNTHFVFDKNKVNIDYILKTATKILDYALHEHNADFNDVKQYIMNDFSTLFEVISLCADLHKDELKSLQDKNSEVDEYILTRNFRLRDCLTLAQKTVEELENYIFAH